MLATWKQLTRNVLCFTAFICSYSTYTFAQELGDTQTNQWSCHADVSGEGWQCAPNEPKIQHGLYIPVAKHARNNAATTKQQLTSDNAMSSNNLGWVTVDQLESEEQAKLAPFCKGTYLEPNYVETTLLDLDPSTQPILASSVESKTSDDGISVLAGDVVISQGYRQLTSEHAVIDRSLNVAHIEGEATYREPGILLIGNDTQINLKTKDVSIQNAEFVSYDTRMRGSAKQLDRGADQIIKIIGAKITQCDPNTNTWELAGSTIELDLDRGVGTAKHARLNIKGVPVLYTPYMQFPIDNRRKTGMLFPQIGLSDDGADIAVPIYLNLAPNYDATITPRYIADRGVMTETEFRYLSEQSQGIIGGAWLGSDDQANNEDRWLLAIDHKGSPFERVRTNIDYRTVSDEDYFSDLGTALSVSGRTHLLRNGQVTYNQNYWDLTVRLQGYQTLDELVTDENEPYDRLPQILLEVDYPLSDSGLTYGLLLEHTWFDRNNDHLTGIAEAVGQRSRLEPSISWNIEGASSYIKPSVRYKYRVYALNDLSNQFDDAPEISVPVYSLDAGVFFERDMQWKAEHMTQTFEPRLFYLKVPEEKDQDMIPDFDTSELTFGYNQLFREDRFIGGDRVGDADQLSVGITSRILEESGFERLRTSLGQTYYFEDRMVTLDGILDDDYDTSKSAFTAEFIYALQSGWRFLGDIEWDPELEKTNESSLSLRYKGKQNRIFNIGYRLRNDRRKLEQTDISGMWPVSSQWNIIARWNQDLIHDRIIEALVGIEYQSCCWSMRLAARRWINDDDIFSADKVEEKDGIYFQIQLKGLAGIGQSLEGLLKDSIMGYQEQDNNEAFKH